MGVYSELSYVPFRNADEFNACYSDIEKVRILNGGRRLHSTGTWIKDVNGTHIRVISSDDSGLILAGEPQRVSWEKLLERLYCFLDGSPCGWEQDGRSERSCNHYRRTVRPTS